MQRQALGYLLACIFGALLAGLQARPVPQNPFEAIGMGAMVLADNAKDIITSGVAVRKEHDIETPLFNMHSKGELGYGEAIRPIADDSDERRRRRRDTSQSLPVVWSLVGAQHPHLHRGKRSPCHTMGGGTGGTGGTGPANPAGNMDYGDFEEQIRRRIRQIQRQRKAAQKKRSTAKSGKTTKTGSTKKSMVATQRRRRRQTEVDDLAGAADAQKKNFADYARNFAEKMSNFFGSIYNSMKESMQRVQQTFSGGQ